MEAYSVVIVEKEAADPSVLADLEIHFSAGPLAGMKLVGAAVRKSSSGGTFVTFPGRAFNIGRDRRYFDYIRPITSDHPEAQRLRGVVKTWMKDAWKEAQ